MKIAYIISHDQQGNLGITRKVQSQTQAWINFNNEVKIFNIIVNKHQSQNNVLNASIYLRNGLKIDENLFFDLESFNPDIVYMRHENYKTYLFEIMKKYKTILEVNTDDVKEQKLMATKSIRNRLSYIYNMLTRKHFCNMAKGIVFVTNEIMNSPSFSFFQSNKMVCPNSITVENYPVIKQGSNSNIVHLFFMGNYNRPWHGVDKIINLAKLTRSEFFFHIVGMEKPDNTPPNMKFYGKLKRKEYEEIIKYCDVGLASFSLYKEGLNEACPLKVREYLAFGLPIIIAYEETPFNGVYPEWVLKIDNSPNTIDKNIDKIREFCVKNKDYIVTHEESKNYIDSMSIEKNKLSFFKKVLENEH